jgi:hypothetical protein
MADKQILIGTSTTPAIKTLTAGTGIVIDNTVAGVVKVSSSVGIGTGGFVYTAPGDPAITANATPTMMGLAGSITIANATRMIITVCGDADNSVNNDGVKMQIYYGTGAAPGNGVAPPAGSTAVGNQVKFFETNNGVRIPFNLNGIGTALTPGTTYWIDIAISNFAGGNARVRDITISGIEF